MGRLIDADALKKENERLLHCDFPYLSETTLEELINEAPTIDAEPVKHGKWKSHGDCGVTECSCCGWNIEECVGWNYCPDCGARMDKDD